MFSARTRYVLFGLVALLPVAALTPPGGASAQPQPTIVLSPASGPCDGTVEVKGSGFYDQPSVRLYVVKPGTAEISMGLLNSGALMRNASFSQVVGLYHGGCEAAALDSRAEQPTGNLSIVASFTFQAGAEPGERIPNIVAVAQYAYTTTVAQPQPTMVLSPSSGTCDATVEVTGRDFSPNTAIQLAIGDPGGEGKLGRLASLVTDSGGLFDTTVTLGTLGCHAASLVAQLPAHSGPIPIRLVAALDPPPGPDEILTQIVYTSTTTSLPPAPQSLPSTGSGPEERSMLRVWLPWVGALASMGLALVAGLLYRSRRLRS